MMNKFLAIVAALLIPLVTACNPAAPNGEMEAAAEPPLAGAKIGGSFSLINQNGDRITDKDFDGKYRIFYFGYTYCPDVCPVDLSKLMLGLKQAEKDDPAIAQKVQPIFVTIDPERDRPKAMKKYVANFHPRLIGLTGTNEEIAAIAEKYLIIYDRRESEGASEYLMDHSRQAYLFGPKGEPLALLPFDGTPREIADEIVRWVR
ncbi:Cytochrome oxidase biogenesis protein Sco1/SenC/PrrC, thiol-disulfide reductase involved in Cu(I) insertion into CoxII Cu(A) center [hydrothermal vent metagenome]|uniref:Cytochrome oxidase biogenesis protein Sco1/SenC/PrrC, thiol-disulfide reductase involved in Cu(I) insertion into CoxII Cu(A) center n=1 Tax=hydrothermal vent metagenome TaxID=652676 RepID=A0A3B0TDL4_9ZZZZ